jgi:hypothetical protein
VLFLAIFSLLLSSWQFLCLMKTRSLHHMKGLLQPFVLVVGIRGVGSLELLAGLLV